MNLFLIIIHSFFKFMTSKYTAMLLFSVCGDCPIILLDRIAGVDTTLDQGKTDARIQEYADKIDRIQEKADRIKVFVHTYS